MTDDTASKRKSRRVLDRETARLIVHTDVRDASDLAAAIEGVISTGNIAFLTSVEPVMMSFPQPHTRGWHLTAHFPLTGDMMEFFTSAVPHRRGAYELLAALTTSWLVTIGAVTVREAVDLMEMLKERAQDESDQEEGDGDGDGETATETDKRNRIHTVD